ncbi:MAG TPA: hemerythrin domain-containing protein [Actinomycetota bacterium]|nr:hemerythrin domain-containing protein [Actinomycetota bacterium]
MDAFELLEDDHKKVKKMLGELEDTTERATTTRQQLFARLKQDMVVHEALEEELLYPTLKEHDKTKEVSLEGYEEHHVVNEIMAELEETPVDDERWAAKFAVMKENIEHHIEEEEGEMFKKGRQVLEDDDIQALGERMRQRKQQLESA